MHVSREQKKCYKMFEEQEVEKAHDLCSSHGARLPLPENDQELDNLKFAIFKIDAKGIGFNKTVSVVVFLIETPKNLTPANLSKKFHLVPRRMKKGYGLTTLETK